MRIALASALVFAALTLAYPVAAEDSEASAKEAYEKGDYATALGLWRKAAQTGDAKAQVNLGRLHALGHGVPKDAVRALMWLNLATRTTRVGDNIVVPSGDIIQLFKDDIQETKLRDQMTPTQIGEAERLVNEWLEKRKAKKDGD